MAMGSTGLSSAEPQAPSDLDAVYQGGQGFEDRMKAYAAQMADLMKQKDEASKALAALAVGKSIKAAQDKAKSDLEAARNAREQAEATLADAKTQAAKIVADAKAQVEDIISAAISRAAASKADILATTETDRKAAALEAARIRKTSGDLIADATAKQAAAEKAQADAEKAQAEAEKLKTASAKALKDAQATQKQFEDKLAKLQAAIS